MDIKPSKYSLLGDKSSIDTLTLIRKDLGIRHQEFINQIILFFANDSRLSPETKQKVTKFLKTNLQITQETSPEDNANTTPLTYFLQNQQLMLHSLPQIVEKVEELKHILLTSLDTNPEIWPLPQISED